MERRMQRTTDSTHEHARRVARRGVVLVFFALFVWIVMGIAALVIDQGVARLTQRQLHSAADGVALEAMRDRDQARNVEEINDFFRDRRRRVRANRFSSWHFTPELVTGVTDPGGIFRGGGAFIDLEEGRGEIDASPQVLASGFGAPRLSANYQFDGDSATPLNLRWGDVVSGTFKGHDWDPGDILDSDPPGGVVGFDGNPIHLEDDKYVRSDFEPAAPGDAPFADSMVVRLRRTKARAQEQSDNDPLGEPDHESQGAVSSSGDALPYFYGRGTTMAGIPNEGREYSPRRDGQRIRATAIGSSQRVVRVSSPMPQHDDALDFVDGYDVGIAPYVVHDLLWHWQSDEVWITEDGGRNYYTYLKHENGFLWNINSDSIPAGLLQTRHTMRIGDKILQLDGSGDLWLDEKNWEVEEAYAPVYHRIWVPGTGFSQRTIGFVRVKTELAIVPDPDGNGLIRVMKLWKLGNDFAEDPETPWIAPRNASAVFDGEQVDFQELQDEGGPDGGLWTWLALIEALKNLERAIHAPVIVR